MAEFTDGLEVTRLGMIRFGLAADVVLATFATDTRNPTAISTRIIMALNLREDLYERAITALQRDGLLELAEDRLLMLTDAGLARLSKVHETSPEIVEMVDMTVRASEELQEHAAAALGKLGLEQPLEATMSPAPSLGA